MKSRYVLQFFILIVFVFSGCQKKIEEPTTFAANLWIGYAPLYYAYEKDWLRQNGIKFVATLSLGQTLKYYKKGSIDIFAGTNYEYKEAKKVKEDLQAIKLLDISKGGDLIYSNRSIDELKRSKNIDIYEEVNSINSLLIKKFLQIYKIKEKNTNLINISAEKFLKFKMRKNPILLVTYKPNDQNLKKRGFRVLDTAKSLNLTIFDALFVSKKYAQEHQEKIAKIKKIFDKALQILKNNPQEFYKVINPRFNYKHYDDFVSDLKSISWESNRSLNSLVAQEETK